MKNLYQCEKCNKFTEEYKLCDPCLKQTVEKEVKLGAELILSLYDKNKKINKGK